MTANHSLFLVHTPYHMVLSYAVAAERDGKSHLYVSPHIPQERRIVELLSSTGTFADTEILRRPYDEKGNHVSNRHRKRAIRVNIRTIRSFFRETEVEAVVSALDDREIVQAALHFARGQEAAVAGVHLEDGCYEYGDRITDWSPYRSDLLNSLVNYVLFGFWWDRVTIRGTSRGISETYVTHPDFLRPELAKLTVDRIRPDPILELGQTAQMEDYFSAVGLDLDTLECIDTVLLMPLDASEELEALVNDVAVELEALGCSLGLKYHPRQRDADRPTVSSATDPVDIPQSIPLELIFASQYSAIDRVIGSHSTALKSAVWLSDDITAISSYPLLVNEGLHDVDRAVLMGVFEEMGIQMLTSVDELSELAP